MILHFRGSGRHGHGIVLLPEAPFRSTNSRLVLRDTRRATRDASTRGAGGRARSYRTQWIPEAFDGPGAEVPSSGASRKDRATNEEERNGGKPTASEENLRRNRRSELPFRHQYEPNKDARDDLVVVLTDGI
eukprot:scaffold282_cov345-Pavlova_lutheri.AAC.42